MNAIGKIKLTVLSRQAKFIYIIMFLTILALSIIFNISIVRQLLGFTFLTFVPGWLILGILKLDKLKLIERFVLCVGLSVAFVMFVGLLMNTIYPLFCYDTPLKTNSLLISFTIITIILAGIAYFMNKEISFIDTSLITLTTHEKYYLLLPAVFPLLAIIGMRIMNMTGNNFVTMVLIILITTYMIFIAIKHVKVPDKDYAPMILCISISLVLLLGLRSNYIIGVDVNTEYYVFMHTLDTGKWQAIMHLYSNDLNSCLSISILPTVYQSFININSEYLFKLLYPVLFSISPLVVYIISRRYLNTIHSFLAVIFFMSQYYFFYAETAARTVIAILFFALAFMVLFSKGITNIKKYILFVIFVAGCVVSHYSTTYIFLSVLILTWIITQIVAWINKKQSHNRKYSKEVNGNGNINGIALTKFNLQYSITFGVMVLIIVMIFFWYSQVTDAAFNSGVSFIADSMSSLKNFFDMGSRGLSATMFGSGLGSKSIPAQIYFIFSWLTIVFVAVGIISTIFKYKRAIFQDSNFQDKTPQYLVKILDVESLVFSFACAIVLTLAVALPYVLVGYDMNRAYIQMTTILSPFFILGGIIISNLFNRKLVLVIILLVLVPYFLGVTGFTNQLFSIHQSIVLNTDGLEYNYWYIHEQDSFAATWLENNAASGINIYSDWFGQDRLISQGNILTSIYAMSLIENERPMVDGYFYLDYTGVVEGILLDHNLQWHNMTDYQDEFEYEDLIYSNGGSEIWK